MRKHGAVLLSHFSDVYTARVLRVFVLLLGGTLLALFVYGCLATKTYAPAAALSLTTPPSPTQLSTSAGALPETQTHTAPLLNHASCTGMSYSDPSPLNPAALPAGLTTTIDPASYYTVSGSTLDDIRAAIAQCPLRKDIGKYHAITTYTLTWGYDKTAHAGTCSTVNARVGIHINQYLPALHADANSTAVTNQWRAYADSLVAHENGHTTIDSDHARRLLLALQSVAGSCTGFDDHIAAIADTYVTMLNTANELYDARTNHGATQGAVL